MATINRSRSSSTTTTGCFSSTNADEETRQPRLWTAFSDGALRRRIIAALVCGVSNHKSALTVIPPSPRPPPPTFPVKEALELKKGEKLEELFKKAETSEIKRKIEAFDGLKDVVRRLQRSKDEDDVDGIVRRRKAAMDVRRFAKDDPKARETLAMLGTVPTLVSMIDSSGDLEVNISSLYALLNLGIGNDLNKAAIVEAGILKKIHSLISTTNTDPPLAEAIAAIFLGLSALDSNKALIAATPNSIRFLLSTFQSTTSSSQSKHDSLRALFNLSLSPANTPYFLSSSLIPSLFSSIGEMEFTDRVLSILSNLVSTPEGRGAIARTPDSFAILIDVLNWNDSPECQEKAVYVLMVLAHRSYSNRAAMVECGIVSTLLELSLLGTAIAQKRAARVLEFLRVDQGKPLSEGFDGAERGAATVVVEDEMGMSEEKKAVRELVQMSLQNNLRRIVKRANLPNDFDFAPSDHFKSVVAAASAASTITSSRSLPLEKVKGLTFDV